MNYELNHARLLSAQATALKESLASAFTSEAKALNALVRTTQRQVKKRETACQACQTVFVHCPVSSQSVSL